MNTDHPAWKDTFRKDGFVQIDGFLNPGEADEIERNLARFIRDVVPRISAHQAMYQVPGRPETLKHLTGLETDPFFAELVASEKIKGVAESLLEQKGIPQSVQFFNKPPRSGASTPPHQDGYYFCLVPNEALTVWIALDDVNQENGAMHYWKGSHRKGVFDHTESHVLGFSQSLANSPSSELGQEAVCDVKRGGCLIHHSLTVHAAGANNSRRPRRAIGMVYYGESARVDLNRQRCYQQSVAHQRDAARRTNRTAI